MTDDAALRILDASIRDRGGEGMQERHERRMQMMRELGRSERRMDNLLKGAMLFMLCLFALPTIYFIIRAIMLMFK